MNALATPNPHLAIDRLAATRRAICALAEEEERLARRVFGLPDGRHGGMACTVEIATGTDGIRRIVIMDDALANIIPGDPMCEMAASPAQME